MLDIADFLRRNNIRAVELAAAFGCSERTVYNWRRQLPPGVADDLEALEAKKREAAATEKCPKMQPRLGENSSPPAVWKP